MVSEDELKSVSDDCDRQLFKPLSALGVCKESHANKKQDNFPLGGTKRVE